MVTVELEGRTAVFKDKLFGLSVEVNVRDAGGQADATLNIPALCRVTPLMASALRGVLLEAAKFAELVNGTHQLENNDV